MCLTTFIELSQRLNKFIASTMGIDSSEMGGGGHIRLDNLVEVDGYGFINQQIRLLPPTLKKAPPPLIKFLLSMRRPRFKFTKYAHTTEHTFKNKHTHLRTHTHAHPEESTHKRENTQYKQANTREHTIHTHKNTHTYKQLAILFHDHLQSR